MAGMIRILVAMEREGEALGLPFEVVGIGATTIPPISPEDTIINVGYCGGDGLKPGTVVEAVISVDAVTGEWTDLPVHFSGKSVCGVIPAICITSPTFVTKPLVSGPAVYDMELAKLARIPCAGLYSLKIVSDNLDEQACEAFSDADVWNHVREMVCTQLSSSQRR